MLFRITGKLQDGRTFSNRIESENALDASGTVKADLKEAGIVPEDIRELVVKPMEASRTGIYIGTGRKGKSAEGGEAKPKASSKKK